MSHSHSDQVKKNFQEQAQAYDSYMLTVVPDYEEMLQCIIDYIPHDGGKAWDIIDLGCGTGNVTRLLADAFPKASISCVDMSPAMMDMARAKLGDRQIEWLEADFYDFSFENGPYDIITSSLALHHLVTDEDKKMFYGRIHQALKPGGVFINADVIDGASSFIEDCTMDLWRQWMGQYHDNAKIEETIKRYYEEDRPTTIINHLDWMRQIGFGDVDVLWKRIKGVVYTGRKG